MGVPFALLMFAAGLWSLVYTLEISVIDHSLKILLAKLRFIGLAPLSTLWLLVGIEHVRPNIENRLKLYLILSIIPATVVALALTSGSHALFRYGYAVAENRHFSLVVFKNGPLFWAYAAYSYIAAIATGFLMQRNVRSRNSIKRRQAMLISSSIALFMLVDILFQMGITPIAGYTLSPAALSVSGAMIGIAVFHHRLLDIAPLTRGMVMNGRADMIFVIDEDRCIIECNRAAATTFGFLQNRAEGSSLASVHPDFAPLLDAASFSCERIST